MLKILQRVSANLIFNSMKNYQCEKCETLVQSEKMPSAFRCPAGGTHHWNDLGEVGTDNYQCKKCGTLVTSKRMPSAFRCPAGGTHQWHKL
jgi:DNA-directed RNA polymerase subunit RPC12/RpoP